MFIRLSAESSSFLLLQIYLWLVILIGQKHQNVFQIIIVVNMQFDMPSDMRPVNLNNQLQNPEATLKLALVQIFIVTSCSTRVFSAYWNVFLRLVKRLWNWRVAMKDGFAIMPFYHLLKLENFQSYFTTNSCSLKFLIFVTGNFRDLYKRVMHICDF